ncbi:MAG: alpha/beta fold hydrolase [Wenzhouxiangellaceae bacterium]
MQTLAKIFVFVWSMIVVEAVPADPGHDPAPYSVERAGNGGHPVYLIPGLSNAGDVWDGLAVTLRANGYRTHVLTLAGFGGQPPLPHHEPFLPRVRDALAAELATHTGLKPVVIGHSLGGFMALWLGATASEHLAGLIVIDGVPFLPALANLAATAESQAASAEQIRTFMASLTPEQFAQQNQMSLEAMAKNESERARIAATSTRSSPASVGRAMAELMTTDLRPMLDRIDVPVLMIQAADSGARDALREAYASQIEAIPDHRHIVADQGGHFVQLDDPEFTAREVLGFLESLNANEAEQ